MPSPIAPSRLRPSQLVAVMALLLALGAMVALAVAGGRDELSLRVQYGGHGGTPVGATGPAGRVALDGRWRVTADPGATGGGRGFPAGRFGGRAVTVPFSPNAGRITGEAGVRSHEGSVAWYRTTIRVPETGRYALRFESVNHRASVYLDGERVGAHVGTYLPFEVRRTFEAGRDHTLVVRADWRDPMAMKAQAWHRAWFNFGGINREVTIRPLGAAEVVGPTVRTRLARGGAARVDLTARVRNATTDGELEVTGVLRRGDERVDVTFPKARIPRGRTGVVRRSVVVPKAALWSPEDPELYDLELRVGDRASWRGRIGLREVRRDGRRLLLNGRRVTLRGASLHEDQVGRGDALTGADMDALVDDLKAIGANATRAQHALSPGLLERLDAAGILVWMGVGPVDAPGAWTSRGSRLVRQARERVRASVSQMQTHPSVFAWNLANEAAGQGHPAGQTPYIAGMAAELKRTDPSRLVALDIWGPHPPRYPGPMYRDVDAIGWTNYLGWYQSPFASGRELTGMIRSELGSLRRVFGDKIIAVTEFGAEGNRTNPTGVHGGMRFQADLLRTHIRAYGSVPDLAGMLVWNLRDFAVAPSFGGGSIVELIPGIRLVPGLNQKGLFDYAGRPKPAAGVVRRELAAFPR